MAGHAESLVHAAFGGQLLLAVQEQVTYESIQKTLQTEPTMEVHYDTRLS